MMNKLVCLLVTIFLLTAPASALTYNGTKYLNCDSCQAENEFLAIANLETQPGLRLVIVNSRRAIETHQLDTNIRTYRFALRDLGDDIPGGGTHPRRIESPRHNLPHEPMMTFQAIPVSTRASDLSDFGDYIDTVAGHALPQFSGAIKLYLEETNWDYTPSLQTVNDEAFIAQYSNLINDALSTISYNPFFFTRKALTVQIETGNDFLVTLANTSTTGQPVWQHRLTRFIPLHEMIVEPSYITHSVGNTQQLAGESCEPFSKDPYAKSGLLCSSNGGSPYARRLMPPGHIKDKPCLPVEPMCNDDGDFYIGIGGIGI